MMTDEHPSVRTEAHDLLDIDITLLHPTLDPKRITEVLSVVPTYCWKKSDVVGGVVKQSTRWQGRLLSGSTPDEFHGALKEVVTLLMNNELFWGEFLRGGGEIELILNQEVDPMEGKVLELHVYPTLLGQLAALGIGLRVQGWNRHSV